MRISKRRSSRKSCAKARNLRLLRLRSFLDRKSCLGEPKKAEGIALHEAEDRACVERRGRRDASHRASLPQKIHSSSDASSKRAEGGIMSALRSCFSS